MSKQIMFSLVAVLSSLVAVNAHGYVVTWTVNGKEMKGFDPSWVQEPGGTAQRPYFEKERGFADYHKIDVACGGPDPGTKLETWPVDAGSDVTATWDQWPQPHEGPIMQYMAACPSTGCDGVDAAGLGWFKISEDAYDGTEWATDKLFRNPSWTFKIPAEVAPGPYLIRHEIIAMHYAHEPQVYPVCFQANVSGSGSSVPAETVTFPDAYSSQSISDDFETFDVHDNKADKASFVPPGPAVAVLGPGSAAPSSQPSQSASASASATASSASGEIPAASQSDAENAPAPSASSAPPPQASEVSSSAVEPVVESSSTVAESAQASSPTASEPAGDQNQGDVSQGSNPSPVSQGSAASGSSTSGRGRNRPHRQGHPRACGSKATAAA